MRIGAGHLTYCTNIHPGETWSEIRSNLERHLLRVRDLVAPGAPFGIGLRLSSAAADRLAQADHLAAFRTFLQANNLYVFTINGFPYGAFHRTRVKEDVYKPDWRDERRLAYTDRLATLLAALLPADTDIEGSVSTVPGAFKPEIRSPGDVTRMAEQMLRHAAHLVRLRAKTGRTICLALEPEPFCFLETVEETAAFFENHLFSSDAIERLSDATGLNRRTAEESLRRHLGVCFDLCHAAVEFEVPRAALARLDAAGISIAKMQLSAGLRVARVDETTLGAVRPFAEDVYLHQVVERSAAGLKRYPDLGNAFGLGEGAGEREWRIHFHVPIFREDLGAFSTTQPFMRDVLAAHREKPISAHLEVETYTWDVLPREHRGADVVADIARELIWARRELGA